MNQPFSRFIARFAPVFFLLLTAVVYLGGGGCLVDRQAVAQTQELQQRLVQEQVRFAIEALKRGESQTAEKTISEAQRLLGGKSDAMVTVAEEILRNDQPVFAAKVLQNAVRNEQLNWDPMLWAELARAQVKAGNAEAADPAFREAEQRGQVILQMAGQAQPATMDKVPAELQETIIRFLQAGNYFGQIKRDPDRAILALREAHRLLPDSPIIQNAYGYTLANMGTTQEQFEEALILTERATKAMPYSGAIRDSLGWALYRKGSLADARRILQEAAEMDPDVAEIHYHLAVVTAEMGLIREAEIAFGRALSLQPNFPEAQAARSKLREQ